MAAELLVFLDISVVNVALPSIGSDLAMSEAELGWIVSAYLLAFGGFQLVGGRCADVLGRRRVFQTGLVVFTLASLVAGLSPTGATLIAARAVQGLGAALLVPAQLSLLATMFAEPRASHRAFGVWSAMAAAGAAAGGAIGGVVIMGLGWEWIFLVNVPVGLIVLLAGARLIPADHRTATSAVSRLDLRGAVLVTVGMLMLGYGIGEFVESPGTSAALIGLSSLILIGFFSHERRVPDPLLPLRLFRVRNVSASALTNVMVGAAHVPAFVLLAMYFQEVWTYSALTAGVAVLPIAVINIAASRTLVPAAMHRYGPRTVVTAGMLLQAIALAAFAWIPSDGVYLLHVLPPSVLFALGLPAAMVGVTVPAMTAVPADDTGVVGAIVNSAQRLGSGLGATIVMTLVAAAASAPDATSTAALADGVRLGFLASALFATAGAAAAALGLRAGASGQNQRRPSIKAQESR
ncbi:MFS transporter [Streptomyces sp. NPDC059193]|uniref:MFS transporter n=1 Tax=Streptomyces sp. NPDC059193 TaxID=3346763 RepID=UPI0036ACD82D